MLILILIQLLVLTHCPLILTIANTSGIAAIQLCENTCVHLKIDTVLKPSEIQCEASIYYIALIIMSMLAIINLKSITITIVVVIIVTIIIVIVIVVVIISNSIW